MKIANYKEFEFQKRNSSLHNLSKGGRENVFITSNSLVVVTLQSCLNEIVLFVLFQKNGKQHKKYVSNISKNKRQNELINFFFRIEFTPTQNESVVIHVKVC